MEEGSAGGGAGEDARMARVFEGGDTLTAALAGIHDRHLALVFAREADLRQHLHTWLTETLQEVAKSVLETKSLQLQKYNQDLLVLSSS